MAVPSTDMATAPRINLFDGSGTTTSLTITTNATRLVFTGEVDNNTVDIQIDVNGAGFTSNPALVDLSLPDFTVPNLTSFPDGIELELGQNTIRLRAQDIAGQFSPVSTITVMVMSVLEFADPSPPPTGIKIQRNSISVQIEWSDFGLTDSALPVTGFNMYASTGPGGTESGYLRINKDMISVTSPTERIQEVSSVDEVSFDIDNPQPGSFFDLSQAASNLIVSSQIQDSVTNKVLQESSNNSFDVLGVGKIRLTISVDALTDTNFFSFVHDRNDGIGNGILNSDAFSVVDPEDPLFYVMTTVSFDKATGQMLESRFSQEIAGKPIPLDTTVRGIRIREQGTVVQDYITELQRAQPKLSLIPASTVREVHVEPFANEIQKAYFLMDFVHRAKSFAALLQIDHPNYTGESIPVANSA